MIDSHFHIWQLARPECSWPTRDEPRLYRDFSLDDFSEVARAAGVGRGVLVQSQESERDTLWLLAAASDEPLVAAVVGWIDFHAADAVGRVGTLASQPKLAGLRPMVQDKGGDWYDEPALDAVFEAVSREGLRLDALVRTAHLASLERLARRRPELEIVIDHAAKPRIGKPGAFEQWLAAMRPLAGCANVACKMSGMLTECRGERSAAALTPYVSALLDMFGAERLMWGSDWPVLEAVGDYGSWLDMARTLVPAEAHEQLFSRTAARLYGLEAVEAL